MTVRQWQVDDIIYVENDICVMAYVVTDDPVKIGTGGWHGPRQIWVEYVARSGSKTFYPDTQEGC